MKQLHLAVRNRKNSYSASNAVIGDKIYIRLNIPSIHKRKNRNFEKFIGDLSFYILMELICAVSEVEGLFDKTFCSLYNCKCMKIAKEVMK